MRRLLGIVLLALVLAPGATAATRQPVFGLRAAGNPKLGYFVYPLKPGAARTHVALYLGLELLAHLGGDTAPADALFDHAGRLATALTPLLGGER